MGLDQSMCTVWTEQVDCPPLSLYQVAGLEMMSYLHALYMFKMMVKLSVLAILHSLTLHNALL